MPNKIKPESIMRVVIAIRRKRVYAFVEGVGRVLVAEGDDFKTDWTLKEIVKRING